MYPHERSLVAALEGRPFALLGVNSDKRDRVLSAIEREGITWRTWWDGGSTGGPIASQYQVRGWPTIYVIDHQGVICYKNLRGTNLDAAVELLLAKAEVASFAEASEFPVVGPHALQMRKWSDTTGEYSVRAAFVKFHHGEAHLEKEKDGQVIQVSMTKLSEDDQQYIRDKLRARRERR